MGFTRVGSKPCLQMLAAVADSDKYISLIWYRSNYAHKNVLVFMIILLLNIPDLKALKARSFKSVEKQCFKK